MNNNTIPSDTSGSDQYTIMDEDFLDLQSCLSQLTHSSDTSSRDSKEECKFTECRGQEEKVSLNLPNQVDEWKQVFSQDAGRVYYYNRRTRESAWKLPKNAVLVGKTNLTTTTDLQNNGRYQHQRLSVPTSSARNIVRQVANGSSSITSALCADKSDNRTMDQELSLSLSLSTIRDQSTVAGDTSKRIGNDEQTLSTSRTHALQPSETFVEEWDCKTLNENDHICQNYCILCGDQMKNSVMELSNHLSLCKAFRKMNSSSLGQRYLQSLHSVYQRHICGSLQYNGDTNQLHDTSTTANSTLSCSEDIGHTPKRAGASRINQFNPQSLLLGNSSTSLLTNSKSTTYTSDRSKAASTLLSRCPFCSKEFTGDKLSGHLLRCTERKKARERRQKNCNAFLTPERKEGRLLSRIERLLTSGGRQLPGHPSLDRGSKTQ